MKEFLLSLLSIALCGSVFRMLIPRNGSERILRFVIALVVLLGGISLIVESGWLSGDPVLPSLSETESQEAFRQEVEEQTRQALAEQIRMKTLEFSGKEPKKIEIELSYEEGVFVLGEIAVEVQGCEEEQLKMLLSMYFGYDGFVIRNTE